MANWDTHPITGNIVRPQRVSDSGGYFRYPSGELRYDDVLLERRFAEDYQRHHPYRVGNNQYSIEDVKAAWCLVRSHLWRSMRSGLEPILVCEEDKMAYYDGLSERLPFIPVMFERLIIEARSLTLVDKALNTLQNLYSIYKLSPQPFTIRYATPRAIPPMAMVFKPLGEGLFENGEAYGCDENTAMFAYEYLADNEYIRPYWPNEFPLAWLISAKGYDMLDRLQKGRAALGKSVFFVRRYDEDLDRFLVPITVEVGKRLDCEINAVWSKPHNARLDEKIFREIRTSSVVLVDVSPTNFNVGLELGYALALGKPIVVIMEKPEPVRDSDTPEERRKKVLPFDINTLNCFFYERDKGNELLRTLEARIGIEFDIEEQRGPSSPLI